MSLSDLFAESTQLPHIPKVVQELIESLNDEDADMDALSKKVALDQALTAKVLRLANSAHYGISRDISTAQDAVTLLGFSTLRTMVLASGMTSAFKAPEGFDQAQFWRDSFAVAALSQWLAGFTPDGDKDTAFTCGMLHSIGQLLIHSVMPDAAKSIDQSANMGGTRHLLEQVQLGFTSAEAGAELARRWKFPTAIQEALAGQNNPELEKPFSNMAGLLYIARYLRRCQSDGTAEDDIIEGFPSHTAHQVGLDEQRVFDQLSELEELSSGLEGLLE
ncbi:histidine kinase [Bacterioplanes sanyensis]|uniref:Histidine kinase n=1 Tax=Bacterioplanes sanyensis TaxID=1249553 RepID=A0A222FJW4_9GAMM|nr:HDOD domain-containing protein [Bacterioplanes sanyensis]ASP39298.1 histidine kinase [Bacterioplanes sanyensis]